MNLCAPFTCRGPYKPEESVRSLELEVVRCLHGCWELNSGPLQEQ